MILPQIANPPAGDLPLDEVAFHPNSFGDPAGRIFQWRGEIYRAIRPGWAQFYQGLLKVDRVQSLMERGLLVASEPAPLHLAGFDLVIFHARVPFPSYVHEWCGAMLKDAALAVLTIAVELASCGLRLKDSHPWNVLFDGCNPVYVDLTSIAPEGRSPDWHWYGEFCRYTLYPLLLFAYGQEHTARWLLWDYGGIPAADAYRLARDRWPVAARLARLRFYKLAAEFYGFQTQRPLLAQGLGAARALLPGRFVPRQAWRGFLTRLCQEIEGLPLPARPSREGAPRKGPPASAAGNEPNPAERRALGEILDELSPATMLDIGSHSGWRSVVAAQKGIRTVAFDLNPERVAQLYSEARSQKLPVLPLVMDFSRPTPAYGLAQHGFVAAEERFQCDLVLMFSALPHLVFGRGLTFEQIAGGLAKFSKRWLLVEFVPYEDPQVQARWPGRQVPEYQLVTLVRALGRWFHPIQVLPSTREGHSWLLCGRSG